MSTAAPRGGLRNEVLAHFAIADFPALNEWGRRGLANRPLADLRILVAFPTWPNTLALYLTLMESGAELVFTPGPVMPHDPATVERLPQWSVRVTDHVSTCEPARPCARPPTCRPQSFRSRSRMAGCIRATTAEQFGDWRSRAPQSGACCVNFTSSNSPLPSMTMR